MEQINRIKEFTATDKNADTRNFTYNANRFCAPKSVNYAVAPAAPQEPDHKCPACLKPWLDENGKFNACPCCPYRITPKPQM